MAKLLLLESATPVCSVAIASDGQVLSLRESSDAYNHSQTLTKFIEEAVQTANIKISDLDGVAVSCGPGSYTGLRIGVSAAKGICYALDIPLIGISSLHAMADWVSRNANELNLSFTEETLFCPMLDARRMEVYTALFNSTGEMVTDIHATIIDKYSFEQQLTTHDMIFFGNGADKCSVLLEQPKTMILKGFKASARFMSLLAEDKFKQKRFEDVAYFEPFYLKDFVATVPKNKIF